MESKVTEEKSNSKKNSLNMRNKGKYADEELKKKLKDVIDDDSKTYSEILKYIDNEIKESTRIVNFQYQVFCFREDGAFALNRAVEEIHGFSTQKDRENMSGKNPPEMMDIRFADGTRKKVPFGVINLPSLGKDAYLQMDYDYNRRELLLVGQCEKRFVRLMDSIVERTKQIVETDSIYRGQAIKLASSTDGSSPEFIDLSSIDKVPVFLTPDARFSTMAIEARIEKTEECIKRGIDLKFGVLLEGSFGTGKTLYAFKLARKAIQNGWSFIYCQKPEDSLFALVTANMLNKNGKGVVVFIEDIDRILSQRNDITNQISLMMDGGETKGANIITILTTNYVEKIDPTFLRGKRVGTIVSLTHPDTATAREMIMTMMVDHNGESILADDCTPAAAEIERLEIVPAFIAEILDRVKSHLIYTGKEKVTCEDIINSIKSYKTQMDIASIKKGGLSKAEQFVSLFREFSLATNAESKRLLQEFAHENLQPTLLKNPIFQTAATSQ